ncbi:G1/S-specific cyclin-E1 isoform X2 [Ischnura elegans]|uniref:G1/S-specific cyclin-E1 isoform X2 n=1 Tax=Ischnura elegans TaxID=197161 RepID=UPI001ED891B2|nr:G1/S-specific cyclin-E1 isoform X2 [Ischnura elegans]
MRDRSSSSSGMGSRKRKYREDDQDENETVWQEPKRQAVRVDVGWSSPDEWTQRVADEALSSGTNEANSDLDLLDGLSIGKDERQEESSEGVITSEDTDTRDEANKENSDVGNTASSFSPNVEVEHQNLTPLTQSGKELPSTLSPWLLTPPSLSTQSQQTQSTSSSATYGSPQSMPLPSGLGWADSTEVWDILVSKEKRWSELRNPKLFSSHPSLEPRMRSILLDWLMEVCEVYKLHRETYYLAQDFIDRFLSAQQNVPKQQLQLIGITSLFIAAKVEEIYPPKICEFAYVTDGACDENEILEKELIILKALKWDLSSVTVNSWLTIFLQLYGQDGTETKDDDDDLDDRVYEVFDECSSSGKRRAEAMTQLRHSRRRRGRRRGFTPSAPSNILKPPSGATFVFPQFPGIALVRAAFLADFATLDAGSLRFPYSVIAASTLYHVVSKEVALSVSGFRFADIKPCVEWMSAFAIELKDSMDQLPTQLESVWARLGLGTAAADGGTRGSALLKTIPRLVVDDSHNIQTHLVDLDLLEKAQERLARMTSEQVRTPPLVLTLSTSSSPSSSKDTDESSPAKSLALLTPPASSVKSFAGSSSVGDINITPSTASTPYRSADFCVG